MSANMIYLIALAFVVFVAAVLLMMYKCTLDLTDSISSLRSRPTSSDSHKSRAGSRFFFSGVTLFDLCTLCPATVLKIKDNDGGFEVVETNCVPLGKIENYKRIFVLKVNGETHTVEVSDPTLL